MNRNTKGNPSFRGCGHVPPPWGRGDRWALALVGLLSLGFHLLYFRHGVQNLVDLGVACVDAERLLLGQLPGRDFMESYGPGRFVLTALAFLAVGKSLLTFSALCVGVLAVKDLLLFRAARFLLSQSWALYLTLLCIVVHGPTHKAFLSFALVLVILPALALIERPRSKGAFLLGLAVAGAGLFRLDMGAAGLTAAGLLLFLLPEERGKWRRLALPFAGGALLLGGPYLLYLALIGNLPWFVIQHWKRIHSLELANADAPGFLNLLHASSPEQRWFGYLLLLMGLVVISSAALGWAAWRSGGRARKRALALGVVLFLGILAFNQVRLGVKFSRFGQIAPPFFFLLAVLLQALHRWLRGATRAAALRLCAPVAAFLFFAGLCAFLWTWQGHYSQDAFSVLRLPEYAPPLPRSGCFFKYKKGKEIEEVVKYLETFVPPGRTFFTGPSCPLFLFLAGRPNPTPFTDFTFYYFDEENQRVVIRALEEARVSYIVNWPRELTGFLFTESAPILTAYIKTHFHLDRYIGRFAVLKRIQ